MTASYTFDVFTSLDGYGAANGSWSAYWGTQGPEMLAHRLAIYSEQQRLIFGADTFRDFSHLRSNEPSAQGPWLARMRSLPVTVVSTTLQGPFDWSEATVINGDGVEIITRLKADSDIPLRSHGSPSLNRALMAAGLVDRLQVTLFPMITGDTGLDQIFEGAEHSDLELVGQRTLDGQVVELSYRPTERN